MIRQRQYQYDKGEYYEEDEDEYHEYEEDIRFPDWKRIFQQLTDTNETIFQTNVQNTLLPQLPNIRTAAIILPTTTHVVAMHRHPSGSIIIFDNDSPEKQTGQGVPYTEHNFLNTFKNTFMIGITNSTILRTPNTNPGRIIDLDDTHSQREHLNTHPHQTRPDM